MVFPTPVRQAAEESVREESNSRRETDFIARVLSPPRRLDDFDLPEYRKPPSDHPARGTARELIKRAREGIGTVSEADFSLCSGLLKEKSNEADGPEIECHVSIHFGVFPYPLNRGWPHGAKLQRNVMTSHTVPLSFSLVTIPFPGIILWGILFSRRPFPEQNPTKTTR